MTVKRCPNWLATSSLKTVLRHLSIIASFVVFTYISSRHLLNEGYRIIRSPDFYFHYNRFVGTVNHLTDFQTFPKVNPVFLEGWGYTSPLFYGDYLFVIGQWYHKLGFSMLTSYKLFLATLTFLCLVITYYTLNLVVKNSLASYLIALLYTLSTFRLYDLFVRNALGEASAFLFFPLIVVGMWGIRQSSSKKYSYLLAIGMSGLVMTHLLSTILVMLTLVVIVILDYQNYLLKFENLKKILVAALFSVGLTAWFTLPMLEQLKQVAMRINAAPIPQKSLFLTDFATLIEQSLNNISLISGNVGILLLLPLFLRGFIKQSERNRSYLTLADSSAVIGIVLLLCSTSLLPWEQIFKVSFLSVIQFPFRFLGLASMMLAISAGIYLYEWTSQAKQAKLLQLGVVMMIALFTLSYNHQINLAKADKVTEETAIKPYEIGTGQEYLPVGAAKDWLEKNVGVFHYDSKKIQITDIKQSHEQLSFNYQASQKAEVKLPLLNYPGYVAKNQKTGATLELQTGQHGELVIDNLKGSGTVKVNYEGTLLQKISGIISLISVLLFGYGLFKTITKESSSVF